MGSSGLLDLIQKEPAVKIWNWRRWFRSLPMRSPKRDGAQLARSAIRELPVSKPLLGEEVRRERDKSRLVPAPELPGGGKCPACGSATTTKILNYWCDSVTDIITPADTKESCVSCGWAGPLVENQRPF